MAAAGPALNLAFEVRGCGEAHLSARPPPSGRECSAWIRVEWLHTLPRYRATPTHPRPGPHMARTINRHRPLDRLHINP